MKKHIAPASATFAGSSGNRLVADVFGDHGPAVILLHGGGQTRHAWRATAEELARRGWASYAMDQRGHGDSDWVEGGAYSMFDFAADVKSVASELTRRSGQLPAAIGASLGGMAALVAEGETLRDTGTNLLSAIVLVDIAPRVDYEGVAKIQGFMRTHAKDGFASVEDAAQAVADYLPHRPRPKSNAGLKKNLRLAPDGRWRWHWDPRFMDGKGKFDSDRERMESSMVDSARALNIPTLLVRGGSSELVQEEHVKEFLALAPHAEYVDVAGARHMVAGDQNDHFAVAVLEFLGRMQTAEPGLHPAKG